VAIHDPEALALPQVFSPAAAAEVLRDLGLTELTECALRTRAYRRQVPFHMNGRRIVFTVSDLREIAEGETRRPKSPALGEVTEAPHRQQKTPRNPASRGAESRADAWRARHPRPAQKDTTLGPPASHDRERCQSDTGKYSAS
jgi:hypothetical protein